MNALRFLTRSPWRMIALVIFVFGFWATVRRFALGLGAATNLDDGFPWGLWVSFDILCGVGLAGGGFTVSAMVYLLRIERFRPVARPAVLTAFIGYLMVVGGLMFDLGHPWRIWHPLIMWNHHSVMFEIAWCVTLYTTVLAAEVSAMVFERFRWERPAHWAHLATVPLTFAAVLLSMLHQSSLGSLFLLVPGRLHELWYSPLLPLLFFTSAIGAGLSMTIVESTLSARAFGRCVEASVLRDVARVAVGVYATYIVLRLADLIVRGAIVELWPMDRASWFFLAEILLGFIAPMLLFAQVKVRHNTRYLYHAAQLAVIGFVVNRLNVGITGFEVIAGRTYIPSWEEVSVTLMLVTTGVVFFRLAAEYLPVFEHDARAEQSELRWKQRFEDPEPTAHPGPIATSGGDV